jgi:hypothetical protein
MHNNNKDILSGIKTISPGKASKTEFIVVLAFLLYFAAKAFYFAFSIGENIFPDEISWLGLSEVFSRSLLLPADSNDTYQFGLASRVPVLYFYLMGKVLSLNIFPVSNLVFLRSVNVCIRVQLEINPSAGLSNSNPPPFYCHGYQYNNVHFSFCLGQL